MGYKYFHHHPDCPYFSVGSSLQILTFGMIDDSSRPRTMSFVGSEDYIRAQFEDYTLALLSSVKYDNYLQEHSLPTQEVILPEIGINLELQPRFSSSRPLVRGANLLEGVPVRDFGQYWTTEWRKTQNYAIWMALTDQELFDIVEPRHPCAGTLTLSLEDVQLRVAQKVADLKIDERVKESRDALSRTWVNSSTKVRGAVGSAWAGLDQYRTQRKPPQKAGGEKDPSPEGDDGAEKKEDGGEKKETFVGSWAAWAAEKRKKAFHKEEPVRLEPRADIGPAPARPLAQWAKRKSESSTASGIVGGEGSVRSSSDTRAGSVGGGSGE
jgi:Transport protein Avl9